QGPAPAPVLDLHLLDRARADRLGQQLRKIGYVEIELDVPDRSSDVGRDQIEMPLRERRKAPDSEVMPDHHDAYLDAREQIVEIVVQAAQLLVAVVQLLVDGPQLLVARLDLLLRSLELFVDALQLLVGGLHFLVRRLQLLVGRLLLLDGRLQVLARRTELLGEARDLILLFLKRLGLRLACAIAALSRGRLGVLRPAGILEQYPVAALLRAAVPDRNHRDREAAVAAVRLHAHVRLARDGVLLLCLLQQRAQGYQQALPSHLQDVETRLARSGREVQPGIAAKLHYLAFAVDQHAGGHVTREQDSVGFPLDFGVHVPRLLAPALDAPLVR